MRSISDEEVETFWRDGVVCLRQAVPPEWIELVARSMEEWLASPQRFDLTQYGADVTQAHGTRRPLGHGAGGSVAGRFYSGTDSWRHFDGLRRFACDSPLPGLVAPLLRTSKVNLYEDSILIKEPGTPDKTYFHQDISYFHVEGEQICTSWLPVDPVSEANGTLQFIKGSHRWGKRYRPNHFVTDLPMDDTDGEVVPDFHADRRGREVLRFDLQPGDLTVHHCRTLHGAAGNASPTMRRRALSVRYCGDDARYRIRRGVPQKPHHAGVADGEVLDHPDCPVVWRAAAASPRRPPDSPRA
jgi:ectoine hydroxylase-related dioxygenase (phytanoyl-CoA dioxygenase family)